MPTCREIFEDEGLEGDALRSALEEHHPSFGCEDHICSGYSPGPVANEEELAFLLVNPLHYDKERNTVSPLAFRELTTRDLSTLRRTHATKREANLVRNRLIERGRKKVPEEMRLVDEACLVKTADVRQAQIDGSRVMGVYDTGLEDIPAHASIFASSDACSTSQQRKRVRSAIHALMTDTIISFDELSDCLPD